MTAIEWIIVVALVAVAGWLATVALRPTGQADAIRTTLPAALRSARIFAREKSFKMTSPCGMAAKPDEVFELDDKDGTLVVSETKSRYRDIVYPSDVMQISVAGVILAKKLGRKVSPTGYVRMLTPRGNAFVPVRLLSDEEVYAARRRWVELKDGRDIGRRTAPRALCPRCAYAVECQSLG